MNIVSKNILANYLGKFWSILSNFAFIPFYIKYLGFSSYSVISFTLLIAGIIAILDAGLSATLLREFARGDNTKLQKIKTYETVQVIFWFIAILSIIFLYFLVPYFVFYIKTNHFSYMQLVLFIKIALIDLVAQLLFRLYFGGLIGLNKHVLANSILIFWGVLRNALVIYMIIFYKSLLYFLIWQAVVTIFCLFLIKFKLDSKLYEQSFFKLNIKFDKESFNKIKNFAGGIILISLTSVISMQADRILITKLLDLNTLAYYTLALSLSSIFIAIISPIATTVLPIITEKFSTQNIKSFMYIFNRYNIFISIVVFSLLINIIFFSEKLLYIWTGDFALSKASFYLVPYLATGYACIVLQTMYYQTSLAKGYTKINYMLGYLNIIVILPTYYFFGKLYGALGISLMFMIIQILNLILYIFLINNKFIQEKFFKTLITKYLLLPFITSLIVAFCFYVITIYVTMQKLVLLLFIGASIFVTMIVNAILFLPIRDKDKLLRFLKVK